MVKPVRRANFRRRVFERYNYICQICGIKTDETDYVSLDANDPKNIDQRILGGNFPTLDHIIPAALGGSNSFENMRLLCHDCNFNHGQQLEFYFKLYRKRA